MVPKYIKENANEVVGHLEYNAERPHLIIPEYGRHLQKLIDQAKVIADREERTRTGQVRSAEVEPAVDQQEERLDRQRDQVEPGRLHHAAPGAPPGELGQAHGAVPCA